MSDPEGVRRGPKEAALLALRAELHAAGAGDEREAAALAALYASLAEVTGDEFPTPADFAEAVALAALRARAEYLG